MGNVLYPKFPQTKRTKPKKLKAKPNIFRRAKPISNVVKRRKWVKFKVGDYVYVYDTLQNIVKLKILRVDEEKSALCSDLKTYFWQQMKTLEQIENEESET